MITDTAQKILEERYFLDGESEWDDVAYRVANFFANSGVERGRFYNMMSNLDALPNSPTLMNAGTNIKAYSACYVLPIEDSIESIFKFYSDAAKISKSGGGVGANYSSIRKGGDTVGSTGGVASGPISFMKGQDALTEVIKQGGRRRGANMMILDHDHPDILNFIKAKDEPGVLENANLSVRVSDHFMNNVTSSEDNYTGVKRDKELWDEIIKRAWSSAEPGVLFGDAIERGNVVPHLGELRQTNPCGEQPLLPYESCSLIAINLSNHVGCTVLDQINPAVNWEKLEHTVHTAVLFMNRVLDKSEFPIPECQEAMEKTRKIGVGIMGLHDLLIQLGVPYDSEEGRQVAGEVMRFIAKCAARKSNELGIEEGAYSGYDGHGGILRNANRTTIAPTGTLSMIADCSSGCEPYYAPITIKEVLNGTKFVMPNKWLPEDVKKELDAGVLNWRDIVSADEYELFKGAQDIPWQSHILMQASLQKHVDSSISKTINMPNSATEDDIKEAYELAWKEGCKGITIYRDGSRDEQVLSSSAGGDKLYDNKSNDSEQGSRVAGDTDKELPVPWKLELEDELDAVRYRIKDQHGNKVYFTVCTQDDVPVEVFARLPEEVQDSYWHTISRLLSLCLRFNVPLDDVTKQLRKSSGSVSDIPSKVARILDKYKTDIGDFLKEDLKETYEVFKDIDKNNCPNCGEKLIPEGGCFTCRSCGWEKCS